jgi:two-component system, cell cycle sensor histidine kinase and response regulator CckA
MSDKETKMGRESRRISLTWKIGGAFAGVMLTLGFLVIAAVYQMTKNALRDQLDQRVLLLANNLSDAAAGHLVGGNLLALHALARKYTLLDGVAYAFIKDGRGNVVAHTLGTFPPELQEGFPGTGQRQIDRRELSLGGIPVYETSVPILEGQLGTVHVGFWAAAVEQEILRSLVPLIGMVTVIPLFGALLSFLLAYWIVRPIAGLTKIADKVTMGDLETSVSGKCVSARDEIGDLARALERMRSSLKAAMLRLGRETV